MRRTVAVAALISVVLTGTAQAGGRPDPPPVKKYVRAGERVVAKTVVRFQHRAEAREWVAKGPYYAYVSHGWDEQRPTARSISPTASRVGHVAARGGKKSRSVRLIAPFVVEGFSPGRYRLDVCTAPCTATSEYVHVGDFRLVRGSLERDLRMAIDALEGRANESDQTIYDLTSEVGIIRPITRRISTFTTERIADQDARIEELGSALADVRRAAADQPFPTTEVGIAFIAGALFVGALVLSVRSRENRRISQKEQVTWRRSSRSPDRGPRIRPAPRAAPPTSAEPGPHGSGRAESRPVDRRSYTPL